MADSENVYKEINAASDDHDKKIANRRLVLSIIYL